MYFHGSDKLFVSTTKLVPQIDGYAQSRSISDLEALFERLRPQHSISRLNAVFLADNPDLIDSLGGYTDIIYSVRPIGSISKCDLAWYTEADLYLSENKLSKAKDCAQKYWNGTPFYKSEQSCFEFLCSSADILNVYECYDYDDLSLI